MKAKLHVNKNSNRLGLNMHEGARNPDRFNFVRSFYDQIAWYEHAEEIVVMRQDVKRTGFINSRYAVGIAFEIDFKWCIYFNGHRWFIGLSKLLRRHVGFVDINNFAGTGNLSLWHLDYLPAAREEQPAKMYSILPAR